MKKNIKLHNHTSPSAHISNSTKKRRTKKYCEILLYKTKVTNSTIFLNFVERLHNYSHQRFLLLKSNSASPSPFPKWISQIKSGLVGGTEICGCRFLRHLFMDPREASDVSNPPKKGYSTATICYSSSPSKHICYHDLIHFSM